MNHKFFYILAFLVFCNTSFGQEVANSGMEEWHIDGYYQHPVGWTSSNDFSLPIGPQGVRMDTLAYEGLYAARIITTNIGFAGAPYAGFIVNGRMNVTGHYDIDSIIKAGEPFTDRPDALSGYYKYQSDAMIEDWGHAFVILKKFDEVKKEAEIIGYGENTLLNPSRDYRYFKVDIDYFADDVLPDSIVVAFFSTYPRHPISGGKLWIDNIKLEYATNKVDIKEPASFIIYPNPADNLLIFSGPSPERIKVLDLAGRLLLDFKSEKMLDISSLSPGIYFLSAEIKGSWISQKFLKR